MHFGPGLNIIHGQNAQGKTNLLEAIATLALTRSPRTTTTADLLLWGQDAGLAEAEVHRPPANVHAHGTFRARPTVGQGDAHRAGRRQAARRRARCSVCARSCSSGPRTSRWCAADPMGGAAFSTSSSLRPTRSRPRTCRDTGASSSSATRCCTSCAPGGGGRDALYGFTSELARHGAWLAQARARLVVALAPLAAASLHDLSGQRERITLRYAPSHVAAMPDDRR